jgi:hypothetical protein
MGGIELKKYEVRCKKCLHSNKKGRQEPCNKCSEIQMERFGFQNNFVEKK